MSKLVNYMHQFKLQCLSKYEIYFLKSQSEEIINYLSMEVDGLTGQQFDDFLPFLVLWI